MIDIEPRGIINSSISVPGSKSYTHRALILAGLCNTPCTLTGVLKSQDTSLTCLALKKLGISIYDRGEDFLVIGLGGNIAPCNSPIYLGNSGTSMRLLAGIVSLGYGCYTLTGNKRMHHRPILHLVEAMGELYIEVRSLNSYGYPPIEVKSSKTVSKSIKVDCSISSQYLSSLLLISPFYKDGLFIIAKRGKVVSRPYIDITIDAMENFGVSVEREGYDLFRIKGKQSYSASSYNIEPDCSHACYFWAAAAIVGGSVTVKGLNVKSKQGDIKFLDILGKMGCVVRSNQSGITVTGCASKPICVDMADMPDLVPTLAVVASFAKGSSEMYGIYHLKEKESDRIKAIVEELKRIGISVETDGHKMIVKGGGDKYIGATIASHDDHRIAMSFALVGLKVPGIKISNEACVAKSFPNFWDTLSKL